MKQSARWRASGVVLALLGSALSCLLLGAAPDARPCCSDAPCQAMLASGCCDYSSSIPSARSESTPPLIIDRVEYLGTARWVETSRLLASRPPGIAFGIRTTVLRL